MGMCRRKFIVRMICSAAVACLLGIGLNSGAFAESDKLNVRVMTRNMDAGTDLNYITAPGADLQAALLLTVAEVYASDIPARSEQLADEIAAAEPDLIALQEVTRWDIPTPLGQQTYDQIELLLSALEANGKHYRVAVNQTLTDILISIPGFIARFTDQNTILVRSDLPPGHLSIIGTESHLYKNHLPDLVTPLGTFQIPNGWMAVDVKMRGARFKFANTHLLSAVPAAVSPEVFAITSGIQALQAGELLEGLGVTGLPVILAGDFNSDAEVPQNPPDNTSTAGIIAAVFGADIWHSLYPEDPGYTWPLFFEDQLSNIPTSPFERIDLIYSGGPAALTVERTGTGPGPTGVFASDHVGVVAEFDLENHRPDVPRKQK